MVESIFPSEGIRVQSVVPECLFKAMRSSYTSRIEAIKVSKVRKLNSGVHFVIGGDQGTIGDTESY